MENMTVLGAALVNNPHPAYHILLSKTVNPRQFQDFKVMVIMRGAPGSGKSTIVRQLREKFETDKVCSADDYFSRSGTYKYDGTKIKDAHSYCQEKAEKFCNEGHSLVIIDNTCIKRWESSFYVNLAHKTGYIIIVLTPDGHFTTNAELLAQRNSHGVDAATIRQKLQSFEPMVARYYAWFISAHVSVQLDQLASKQFTDLSKLARQQGVNFLNGRIEQTYQLPNNGTKHITSHFFGKNPTETAAHHELDQHVGKIATVQVTHLIFSTRTLCAAVKLSSVVKQLYDNDDPDSDSSAAHITIKVNNPQEARLAREDTILARRLCKDNTQKPVKLNDSAIYFSNDHIAVIQIKPPIETSVIFASGY